MKLLIALALVLGLGCQTYDGPRFVSAPNPLAPTDELIERFQLWEQVARPSLQLVDPLGGSGSGVVVSTNKDRTLIVTAAHVAPNKQGDLKILLAQDHGLSAREAKTIKLDLGRDLALMRVEGPWRSAAAALPRDVGTLGWGSRVVAYGYPAGVAQGVLTDGRITAVDDDGSLRWSAPTFFGNSGGGVFAMMNGRWTLISVTLTMWQVRGPIGERIPIPHIGRGAKTDVLIEFLKGVDDVR